MPAARATPRTISAEPDCYRAALVLLAARRCDRSRNVGRNRNRELADSRISRALRQSPVPG